MGKAVTKGLRHLYNMLDDAVIISSEKRNSGVLSTRSARTLLKGKNATMNKRSAVVTTPGTSLQEHTGVRQHQLHLQSEECQ